MGAPNATEFALRRIIDNAFLLLYNDMDKEKAPLAAAHLAYWSMPRMMDEMVMVSASMVYTL